jgi:hypothetical protein
LVVVDDPATDFDFARRLGMLEGVGQRFTDREDKKVDIGLGNRIRARKPADSLARVASGTWVGREMQAELPAAPASGPLALV